MTFPPAFRKTVPPKHPGALLPPQLWRMVFSKLQDPKDLKACSETCLAFKSLLDKTKQYWCFELLLPVLLPRLDLHSALNCRQVCKDWQCAVDRMADDSPNNVPYQEDHETHPLKSGIDLKPDLQQLIKPLNLRDVENLKTLLDQTQVNRLKNCRIIGGSITVGPVLVAQDGYWNDAWTCLRDHGSKIRSLELHNPGSDMAYSHDVLYLTILMSLRQCPNLRMLHLEDDISLFSAGDGDEEEDNVRAGTDMVRETYPLPDLVHLESLLMGEGVPKSIQLSLLERYGSRLKKLQMSFSSDLFANLIPAATLGNLTELLVEIERDDEDDHANNLNRIRILLRIPSENLQRLRVDLWTGVDLELDMVLQLCDHFPNLKALAFYGKGTQLVGQLHQNARKIRSVKIFEFFDVEGVTSFDFLECFPSLERFHLKGMYSPTEAMMRAYYRRGQRPHYGVRNFARETVRIREFLYPKDEEDYVKMYESNLWVVCPRLKTFTFEYEWSAEWDGVHDFPGLKEKTVRRCTREELWKFYDF